MSRQEVITVVRMTHPRVEWRWRWHSSNGRIIAASTEGYANRHRAIGNLERITGGTVTLPPRGTKPDRWGIYEGGTWTRGEQTARMDLWP